MLGPIIQMQLQHPLLSSNPLLPSLVHRYDVTVVGVRNGVSSPPSNSLSFVTPAANAPLNTGVAKNPTTVIVKLFPPTLPPLNGGSW